MSGHSKWSTIKHAKGLKDLKRGKIFSKLSKDITVAAKLSGTDDPNFSPMLRVAIEKAKSANMPNDKILRAAAKGVGKTDGSEIVYEKTYEAYSSDGVGVLIDTETDNPNRTLTEVKSIVNKSGGKIVPQGSIAWQFDEQGLIEITSSTPDETQLELLDLDGIQDILQNGNFLSIYTNREALKNIVSQVSEKLEGIEIVSAGIVKKIQNDYKAHESEKVTELVEALSECMDVVDTWRADI